MTSKRPYDVQGQKYPCAYYEAQIRHFTLWWAVLEVQPIYEKSAQMTHNLNMFKVKRTHEYTTYAPEAQILSGSFYDEPFSSYNPSLRKVPRMTQTDLDM